jgi:hypothetical protein
MRGTREASLRPAEDAMSEDERRRAWAALWSMGLLAALWAGAARAAEPAPGQPAPQAGQRLVQCVVVDWAAPGDGPRLDVGVRVFGKPVAQATLDLEQTTLDFAFEDGPIVARGVLVAGFDPWKGTGTLTLERLEYACDLSGAATVRSRAMADFLFLSRYE